MKPDPQLTFDSSTYGEYRLPADPCANKHGGNRESVEAFGEGKDAQRARVFEAIKAAGAQGTTCDELAASWKCDQNQISGRFSELKAQGRIVQTVRRRTRSGAMAGVFVAKRMESR